MTCPGLALLWNASKDVESGAEAVRGFEVRAYSTEEGCRHGGGDSRGLTYETHQGRKAFIPLQVAERAMQAVQGKLKS